jgi:hypothetical protein
LNGKNEWSVWSETSKYGGLRLIIGKLASEWVVCGKNGMTDNELVRSNKCGYLPRWIKKYYWKAIMGVMGIKKALTFCVRAF